MKKLLINFLTWWADPASISSKEVETGVDIFLNQYKSDSLSPAELERLACLAEECAEVTQMVGKVIRMGYNSRNPLKPEADNRELLTSELGDLLHIVNMMGSARDISLIQLTAAENAKSIRIKQYLHYQ